MNTVSSDNRQKKLIMKSAFILFCAIVCLFVFHALYEPYCGDILNRELKRLMTIARSNATYMQYCFQGLHDDCCAWMEEEGFSVLLSQNSKADREQIQMKVSHFLAEHQEEYLYAAILDADAGIVCSAGLEDEGLARKLSDMASAQGTGEYGLWLDDSSYALAVVERIYQGRMQIGTFVGVLDFSTIVHRLFRYVRIGENGKLWVCSAEGQILLCPDAPLVGWNVCPEELSNDEADLQYLRESILKKERGKAIFSSSVFGEDEQMLIAFSRANLSSLHFVVAALMPYSEAISSIQMNAFLFLGAASLAITVLFGVLMLVLSLRHEKALVQNEQRHLVELNSMLMNMQSRQNQLHQKENLQAIGVFTSTIAHEFSNLLTPIMTYCELLMLKYNENEGLYDSLLEMYKSAASCRDLSKQLLSFSRSSKRSETIKAPVGVGELFKNCVRSISVQVPNRIQVSMNCPEQELFVYGNRSLLHQALCNMMINACQSMENGGTLTLSYCQAPVQEVIGHSCGDDLPFIGSGVKLIVADTGCGMDQNTLNHLFDPFFTKGKGGSGTGLGLMIVQNIINQHDGWIDVSSDLGKGSRFTIVLPEYISIEAGAQGSQSNRIIIVHGRYSNNMHLYRRLAKEGEQVDLYTSPLEVIREFSSHPHQYCLLITEYSLDGFSGISLTRTIKRICASFPVILMTNLVHPNEMIFDSASAPSEVMINSVHYDQFRKIVDQWKTTNKGGQSA